MSSYSTSALSPPSPAQRSSRYAFLSAGASRRAASKRSDTFSNCSGFTTRLANLGMEAPPPEPPAPSFLRGDCTQHATVNLADAMCALDWLFGGAEAPSCVAAADSNADAKVDIADPLSLLDFLFTDGAPPAAHVAGRRRARLRESAGMSVVVPATFRARLQRVGVGPRSMVSGGDRPCAIVLSRLTVHPCSCAAGPEIVRPQVGSKRGSKRFRTSRTQ